MTVTVSELMTISTITVEPTTSVQEARRIVEEQRIRHLPVVKSDGHLVGIISDRDLLGSRHSEAADIASIMTDEPQTAFTDTPAYEAAALMVHHGFGCLPVIDTERRLVGLITATDLLLEAHELLADAPGLSAVNEAPTAQIEHAVLRDLLERVKRASYPDTVVSALRELRTFLQRHFRREEAEGGLFARARQTDPALSDEVEALTAQHVEMMSELEGLISDNAALASEGSVDVSSDVVPFAATIAEHERREADLVRRVVAGSAPAA
jgi:CBS domain-containing protein